MYDVTMPNGVRVTCPNLEAAVTLLATIGMTPAPEVPSKKAPKAPKAPAPEVPKAITVNQRSLDRLNKAAGTRYRKAVCFVEAVRDGKAVLPEGFAFGDKYTAYLASGQSRKEFFGR